MKSSLIALSVLLSVQLAEAKTILISDIDDTIKNAHILDKSEAVRNAFNTDAIFVGTNWAYQALSKANPDLKFFYVSNAPIKLMRGSHTEFISSNSYPAGPVLLRESLTEKNHKVKAIRSLIRIEKPDSVILVGDNGERDIPIYDQMVKEHPDVKFTTYIHQTYKLGSRDEPGVALAAGQKGYATAFELVLDWYEKNLISEEDATTLTRIMQVAVRTEPPGEESGALIFPEWLDCRDFDMSTYDILSAPASVINEALDLKAAIEERCSIPGSEN